MQANELRIGNLVIDRGDYHTINNGMEISIVPLPFDPIPLTDEWLDGMKFEKRYSLRILGNFALEWGDFSKCWQFPAGEWRIDVEYVHQLQNLFFALTGEELNISL